MSLKACGFTGILDWVSRRVGTEFVRCRSASSKESLVGDVGSCRAIFLLKRSLDELRRWKSFEIRESDCFTDGVNNFTTGFDLALFFELSTFGFS